MNYAERTLERELQFQKKQLEILNLSEKPTKPEETHKEITIRRISELQEGLKTLQAVAC